jgi:hypothetical protein
MLPLIAFALPFTVGGGLLVQALDVLCSGVWGFCGAGVGGPLAILASLCGAGVGGPLAILLGPGGFIVNLCGLIPCVQLFTIFGLGCGFMNLPLAILMSIGMMMQPTMILETLEAIPGLLESVSETLPSFASVLGGLLPCPEG